MTPTQTISLFAILAGSVAIYLEATGKLLPVIDATITTPTGTSGNKTSPSAFLTALVGLVIILAILPPDAAIPIGGLLILGALVYEHKQGVNF